jgi:hypothetical protein
MSRCRHLVGPRRRAVGVVPQSPVPLHVQDSTYTHSSPPLSAVYTSPSPSTSTSTSASTSTSRLRHPPTPPSPLRPHLHLIKPLSPFTTPSAAMSTMPAQHGHSEACCNIPPVVAKGYGPKGDYEDLGGFKTCKLPISIQPHPAFDPLSLLSSAPLTLCVELPIHQYLEAMSREGER